MNKILLERIRKMLIGARLSKDFWGEALHISLYLIKRSSSIAIELNTPMEIWTSYKSDYNRLNYFGCTAYEHKREDKLCGRVVNAYFLGILIGSRDISYGACIKEDKESF